MDEEARISQEHTTHEKSSTIVVTVPSSPLKLERNFSLFSVCSVGICQGSTWNVLGGSIIVALYNGGPPGILYEVLVVSVFYWIIAACIAELASAIPSAAGVYHWATVAAGPRFGKIVGWYAGWWNAFAWIFAAASVTLILANQVIAMWALFHPDYTSQRWHVLLVYLIFTWGSCGCVMFANRLLPAISRLGLFFIFTGVFITILVCAIMPSVHGEYASHASVWTDWQNNTGYKSDAFAFLLGMLNGAFVVGTPDLVTHLAEEIPHPQVNIPKAIAAQMVSGLLTAFCYAVALFYSIDDFQAVITNSYATTFPLAEIYRQTTTSRGGALGLVILVFLPTVCANIQCFITAGRMLWTLARDDATPFSKYLGQIHPVYKIPFWATFICGLINTAFGALYVGSSTAFNAFVGSFVMLSTLSYLAAILPNALTRRANIKPGPFSLPPTVAYTFYTISCMYICTFVVIFCFPFSMPVAAASMNYSSVIISGLTAFMTLWYLWKRRTGYVGASVHIPRTVELHTAAA